MQQTSISVRNFYALNNSSDIRINNPNGWSFNISIIALSSREESCTLDGKILSRNNDQASSSISKGESLRV